jgi:2-amino-4-hydroxy-6-hydroxymethyldihydropteridine diphosphokinase
MTATYLSLGSNLGDRAANLSAAIARLSAVGKVGAVSSIYETEPVDVPGQPQFLNCVIGLATAEPPQRLLRSILGIERDLGRERQQDKGPRLIDIDIVLFGDSILDTAELTVPHPAMHRRRFVLEPLAEIAPWVRHPLLQKTIRQLRDELPEGQAVRKILSRKKKTGVRKVREGLV